MLLSQRRTAPAQTATTTSLTVQSWRFFTPLTASSESRPKTKRRCGEMRPLKRVRGALSVGALEHTAVAAVEGAADRVGHA